MKTMSACFYSFHVPSYLPYLKLVRENEKAEPSKGSSFESSALPLNNKHAIISPLKLITGFDCLIKRLNSITQRYPHNVNQIKLICIFTNNIHII
jgi:hypothetical protein